MPLGFQAGDRTGPDFVRRHGDAGAEVERFLKLGLDGVFADFPDTTLTARASWFASR